MSGVATERPNSFPGMPDKPIEDWSPEDHLTHAALASQLIAHEVSVRRDRRKQKRQRLTEAIVTAATALYVEPESRLNKPEREKIKRTMRPDGVMAQDPDTSLDLLPFHEAVFRGITALEHHLGQDHPLLDEYVEASVTCAEAEAAKSRYFRSDDERWRVQNLRPFGEKLRAAQEARDGWMKRALAEIDRI
jgi:hypothetical protein